MPSSTKALAHLYDKQEKNAPFWAMAAFVVATFGCRQYMVGKVKKEGARGREEPFLVSVKNRLSESLQNDYHLWIGCFWLILRQPKTRTSITQHLLDMFAASALLTFKSPPAIKRDDSPSKGSKKGGLASKKLPGTQEEKQMVDSLQNEQRKFSLAGPINATKNDERYLELMVYNVSHTDLVLSLDVPPFRENEEEAYCLCRPRFSTFDMYSKKIAKILPSLDDNALVRFPRYLRSRKTKRYHIKPEPRPMEKLPIGFALSDDHDVLKVSAEDIHKDLRVRGKDYASRLAEAPSSTRLNAVFFPLISTLMPQWQAMINEKYDQNNQTPKQVLILVSGVGTPRNWTHSVMGNSTQVCAMLMKHFLQTLYPDLVVLNIHSQTNIFRYDENISFVQNELMPCIQSYRDAHAKGLSYPDERANNPLPKNLHRPFMPDWKRSFRVALSFADGSPARNHAIQAALRPYRPTYYHCWQLKTFWHELKIVDSDIEVHSFEEMETIPALSSNQLEDKPITRQIVKEIKAFSKDMIEILNSENHDIRKFWLRKTHKPVLAVLAIQLESGGVKMYRGTNMEVSMPTGSLCAERNVIGTALADNPSLKREDLKAIAVLSVSPPILQPSSDGGIRRSTSVPSLVTTVKMDEDEKKETTHSAISKDQKNGFGFHEAIPKELARSSVFETPPLHPNSGTLPPSFDLGATANPTPPSPSTPARRISLYSKQEARQSMKSTVVVHAQEVSAEDGTNKYGRFLRFLHGI